MTRTPLVPSDLYRIVTASDPQCAPDGSVYYVRTALDEAKDATQSAVWRAAAGVTPAPFTAGPGDRMARLSPDGRRLAFVRDRDGKRAIIVMPTAGGEGAALTADYAAIGAIAWSADSSQLAFTATAPHDPATARVAHDAASGARHIRGLPFKSDDRGLLDGTRMHLFRVALDEEREAVQITHGDFDVGTPAWSPDGSQLAFAAEIDAPEWAFYSDIFVVGRDGGPLRRLTASNGPMSSPSFSRDGTQLAWIGHEHGDDASGRFDLELLVAPAAGGTIRSLSARLGRSAGNWITSDARGLVDETAVTWSAADRELCVQISDGGRCSVVAFAADGSSWHPIVSGERDVSGFSLNDAGTIAFAYSEPLVPCEIALRSAAGVETRLTDQNPWIAERILAAPRHVGIQTADGAALDGWVVDAPSPGGPLVLEVHGGPHAAYGYAFFFEFQMLAGHGISVAYGNPRGSQSYGSAFAGAINGNWGGLDAGDVLAILDGALASGNYDLARLGIAGGSYGGFMTTWLLGHSKRFAAGVSMRAVNDFVSEAGASDVGWFLESELEAPWIADDGRKLFDGSPMRTARAIEAPLLVEHSERDYRCPIDQGEQLFTLLRRLGKTVEFVRFTGDGHNLSRSGKPRNRVLRLRAIAHWFIRHLRPDGIEPLADSAGALFAPLAGEVVTSP